MFVGYGILYNSYYLFFSERKGTTRRGVRGKESFFWK